MWKLSDLFFSSFLVSLVLWSIKELALPPPPSSASFTDECVLLISDIIKFYVTLSFTSFKKHHANYYGLFPYSSGDISE